MFVKAIAGFDDTMVHIPIASNITRTKRGKLAFVLGIFLAVTLAIIISMLFATAIKKIPYFKYISATLIFILALSIYFELFITKPKDKVKEKLKRIKKPISTKRILKLIAVGFISAFATVIDDTIAYSSLFLGETSTFIYVLIGVYITITLQLTAIMYFSKKISAIPYKKEITTVGLIILSILILTGVL